MTGHGSYSACTSTCCVSILVVIVFGAGVVHADEHNSSVREPVRVSPIIIEPRHTSCCLVSDCQVYRTGAPVRLTFTITNIGQRPIHYSFSTSQQIDVSVVSKLDRRCVWTYSNGKLFSQMVTKLGLDTGEHCHYSVLWPQTDLHGQRVPNGAYTITATLMPMPRLVLSHGLLVDPDKDPNNIGMPTKSDIQTGETLVTDATPRISASTLITIGR